MTTPAAVEALWRTPLQPGNFQKPSTLLASGYLCCFCTLWLRESDFQTGTPEATSKRIDHSNSRLQRNECYHCTATSEPPAMKAKAKQVIKLAQKLWTFSARIAAREMQMYRLSLVVIYAYIYCQQLAEAWSCKKYCVIWWCTLCELWDFVSAVNIGDMNECFPFVQSKRRWDVHFRRQNVAAGDQYNKEHIVTQLRGVLLTICNFTSVLAIYLELLALKYRRFVKCASLTRHRALMHSSRCVLVLSNNVRMCAWFQIL